MILCLITLMELFVVCGVCLVVARPTVSPWHNDQKNFYSSFLQSFIPVHNSDLLLVLWSKEMEFHCLSSEACAVVIYLMWPPDRFLYAAQFNHVCIFLGVCFVCVSQALNCLALLSETQLWHASLITPQPTKYPKLYTRPQTDPKYFLASLSRFRAVIDM